MDELELIQRALPGRDGPSDAVRARARADLMQALADPDSRHRRPRTVGRLSLIPAIGLTGAVAAVVAGVLIASVLRGGAARPTPASAAAVLRRAAAVALASPPARLRPGQWWYSESVGTYRDGAQTRQGFVSAYVSETTRYWIGDGHWIRRERLHDVRPAQPITKPWQRAVMRTFGPNPSMDEYNNQFDLPVSYTQLLNAPTGIAGLTRFVLTAESPPGFRVRPTDKGFVMVNSIHDILIEPMVPGRLRAGLFRVAATIPGAHLIGQVRDHLGRPAIAIGFAVPDQHTEYQLLFDPRSYALLDDREVSLKDPRVVLGNTAFIASGLVHRLGARPSHGDK